MHIALLALAVLGTASAVTEDTEDRDNSKMVQAFITCAGMYQWTAQGLESAGKPSAAEHMRGLGRGAQTAALWVLAADHSVKYQDDKSRSLGEWKDYVLPQIETERIRIAALSEMEDYEGINSIMTMCTEINPAQAEIVQGLRKQGAPQPEPKGITHENPG